MGGSTVTVQLEDTGDAANPGGGHGLTYLSYTALVEDWDEPAEAGSVGS